MSYESSNFLSQSSPVRAVNELVGLLGYVKTKPWVDMENSIGFYSWSALYPGLSFTGVELIIYKESGLIRVDTRTRSSRSYWDLEQQNRTIRCLHEYLGGTFDTDYGKGRYLEPDAIKPSSLESGLYLARSYFHSNATYPLFLLDGRQFMGNLAADKISDLDIINHFNPRFLSNSMIIPFIVGAWEEYCRSSYLSLLRYSDCRSSAYTKNIAKIDADDIKAVIRQETTIEELLAQALSFQRPSIIDKNFKTINVELDITGTLKKPYRGRKKSLFDEIDNLVDERNLIAHTASRTQYLTDSNIKRIINDFEEAGDRIYKTLAANYNFIINTDY